MPEISRPPRVGSFSDKGKEGKISRVSLSSQRISPRLAAAAQKRWNAADDARIKSPPPENIMYITIGGVDRRISYGEKRRLFSFRENFSYDFRVFLLLDSAFFSVSDHGKGQADQSFFSDLRKSPFHSLVGRAVFRIVGGNDDYVGFPYDFQRFQRQEFRIAGPVPTPYKMPFIVSPSFPPVRFMI